MFSTTSGSTLVPPACIAYIPHQSAQATTSPHALICSAKIISRYPKRMWRQVMNSSSEDQDKVESRSSILDAG